MISPRIENRIEIFTILSIVSVFILFQKCETWFPSLWGSHSLGDNFYAIDWDGGMQLIVYNPNPRTLAYGGIEFLQDTLGTTNHGCIEIKHDDKYIAMVVENKDFKEVHYYLYNKECVANIPKDSITSSTLLKGLQELSNECAYKKQCEILNLK